MEFSVFSPLFRTNSRFFCCFQHKPQLFYLFSVSLALFTQIFSFLSFFQWKVQLLQLFSAESLDFQLHSAQILSLFFSFQRYNEFCWKEVTFFFLIFSWKVMKKLKIVLKRGAEIENSALLPVFGAKFCFFTLFQYKVQFLHLFSGENSKRSPLFSRIFSFHTYFQLPQYQFGSVRWVTALRPKGLGLNLAHANISFQQTV